MESKAHQSQIEKLATLLVLAEEIRKLTTIREFGFFSTNETHRLLPYHTAYLWEIKDLIGTYLIAQSGVAEIDLHAPMNQWLMRKIDQIKRGPLAKEIHQLNFNDAVQNADPLESEWPDELPNFLLWCPLLNKNNLVSGGLIFFRDSEFSETDVKMLSWLIASYQYTWNYLTSPRKKEILSRFKERPYFLALIVTIASILLFPVKLSILGEGTVVPKSPVLINAPLQGVIKSFLVSPGEKVKIGQHLLSLDKTDLLASYEISQKDYLLTKTKLRTAINAGLENKESYSEIPILQAQLAVDRANLDYAQKLLQKTDIVSPIDGVVIFDSKEDWVGQPVKPGERILVIANPTSVKLKISLPISNVIDLKIGDKGEFYLYGQLTAVPFQIDALGYNAKLLPNKILAYELSAQLLDERQPPQIGARGTVKIYGKYVPFIYYMLRRPLQSARQTLGI